MFGWQMALAAVAVLFLAFLLWQMRPGGIRRRAVGADVLAARARALAATSPRARAEALCEAGTLVLRSRARWTSAVGSFLRAMNADPTWPESVQQLILAFHRRRPRTLEKILWRRLGSLPWDAAHRPVLLVIAAGLRGLYEKERRDAMRAAVFRRLEEGFGPSPPNPPLPRSGGEGGSDRQELLRLPLARAAGEGAGG